MIRLTPKIMWMLICIQCFFLVNIAYCDSNTQEETVHIHIGENALSGNRDCKLQDEITVSATIRDKVIPLHLKRNDDITLNAPVFTSSHVNGGMAEERRLLKIEDSAEYQDDENMAAMTVTCRLSQDQNVELTLHGLFTFENTVYTLKKSKRLRRSSTSIHDEYTMVPEPTHRNSNDYIYPPVLEKHLKEIRENDNFTPLETAKAGGRHKRQTTQYFIDVLAVIDYSIYKRWYDSSSHTSSILKENEALQNIRRYYAYIMNGVNLRYKSVTSLNYVLNVRLVGYYVAKTSSDAPWTENFRTAGAKRFQVDANKVLSYLRQWTTQQTLPENDHVMAFTGYDLYSVINSKESTATSGLAYISTLCSQFGHSTSLVEDLGGFQCVDTAAHELGHSLGAKHDGDGNTCKPSDRYIMSGGSSEVISSNAKNPWAFSDCSVTYFRNFLSTLVQSRNGINCLTGIARTANVPDVKTIMPGQLYSPDEQCQMIHGASSRRCQGPEFGTYEGICTRLYCLDANSNSTCWQHTAARGTSCGDQKWCVDGGCEYSQDAPSVNEDCVFGDQIGISFNGQTCADFTAGENASYCYQTVVRLRCCASCGRHYTGVQGCEYGNALKGCDSRYCDYEYSDGTKYADNCCQTCGQFTPRTTTKRPVTTRPTVPTTTTTRVITTTTPTTRPTPSTTVAGTCDKNYGDTVGARFNGQTCEEYVSSGPEVCYSESTQKYCCYSCKLRQTGVEGCQYGDSFQTCYRSLCDYVYNDGTAYSSYCCDTCSRPDTTTTAPTTTTPPTTTTTQPTTTTTPSTTPLTTTTTPSTTTTVAITTVDSCQDTLIFGVTCSAYLRTYGRGRCYNTEVATACCRSCEDAASPIEGCRFGDKVNPCYDTVCHVVFDDGLTYKSMCCQTCYGVPDITTRETTPSTTVFTTTKSPTTTTTPPSTSTTTTTRRTTPTTTRTTTPTTTTTTAPSTSTTTRRTTPTTTTRTTPTTTTTITSTTTSTTRKTTPPTTTSVTKRTSSRKTSPEPQTSSSIQSSTTPVTTTTGICLDKGNNCSLSIQARGRIVCYLSTFADDCCESCTAVRDSNPVCPYGDRNSAICSALGTPLQLRCQGVEEMCCDTCKDFVTTGADIQSRSILLIISALLLVTVFAL